MRKWILVFVILFLCACQRNTPKFNGYIDADLTYLSSDKSGRLEYLFVKRGDFVKAAQPLFKLEQFSEKADVKISYFDQKNLSAQRQQVLDQLHYAEINYLRTKKMLQDRAASQNTLDVAKKDLDVLKSQLAGIDFQIKGSLVNTAVKTWWVSRKEGIANEEGLVFDTYFTQNEYIQAGQPVLALIIKQNIKVIFFVPEPLLSKIKLNSQVKIMFDGSPSILGKINYISNIAQYTPPIIYSLEDRQKLVFRVEACVNVANLRDLHLGQPVTVEVLS